MPRKFKTTVLFPGARTDILISCRTPGTYRWMPTSESAESQGKFGYEDLGTNTFQVAFSNKIQPYQFWDPILWFDVVEGDEKVPPPLPIWKPKYPCYLQDLRGIPEVTKMDLIYSVPLIKDTAAGAGPHALSINGESFSEELEPLNKDIPIKMGDVVEFYSEGINEHPSHIHVNPVQIVETSEPLGSSDKGYLAIGDWHDTVLLHVKWAKMRMFMADFPGDYVVHCHILMHEDIGMMGLIDVDDSTDSYAHIDAVKKSAGLPYTCWKGDNHPGQAYNITGSFITHKYRPSLRRWVYSKALVVIRPTAYYAALLQGILLATPGGQAALSAGGLTLLYFIYRCLRSGGPAPP